jgi:uncharacterized Zn-binding protein involved in type VI secretion
MGKPAARMGDSTLHGGIIANGCPTVLIGGMPAARMGDNHVCPMVTPGAPPVPHVGGPVTMGSSGVFIGGLPAARAGDSIVCVGQPDSIISGCQSVLIGETASASSGTGNLNSDTESNGGISASDAARISAQIAGCGSRNENKGHFIEVSFIDNAGLPVSGINYTIKNPDGTIVPGVLTNKLIKRNVPQGSYEIIIEDKMEEPGQ